MKMRVLSVDFDYFVKATASQRACLFPDAGTEKFPLSLQNYIWSTRYGNPDLEKIEVESEAIYQMMKVFSNRTEATKLMIVDSHRYIYDFIKDNYDSGKYSGLDIINIDYHHDYFNIGDELNCGNWVNALYDVDSKYRFTTVNKNRYRWVCKPDSDISRELEGKKWFSYMSFKQLLQEDEPFDLIFICRSGMWSPPHLDEYFKDLYMPLTFTMDALMQSNLEDRYTAEFKAAAMESKKQTEEIMKKYGKDAVVQC